MAKFGKTIFFLGLIIFLTIIAGFFYRERIFKLFYRPTQTFLEESAAASRNLENAAETVADNLQIPWEIVFLPDSDLLVTERPGTLKRIGKEGRVYVIEGVEHKGEGGLLGIALYPRFSENRWIYLYLTTKNDSGLINRV